LTFAYISNVKSSKNVYIENRGDAVGSLERGSGRPGDRCTTA